MPFSDRLRSAMRIAERSQGQVAEAVGLTQGAVSKWVRGLSEPKVAELYLISKYLRVPIDYLVADEWGDVTPEAILLAQRVCEMVLDIGLSESSRRLLALPRACGVADPEPSGKDVIARRVTPESLAEHLRGRSERRGDRHKERARTEG